MGAPQETIDVKTEAALKAALSDGFALLLESGKDEIMPHHVIFAALGIAMYTLRRQPDPEAAWLRGSSGGSLGEPAEIGAPIDQQLVDIIKAVLEDGETEKDPDQISDVDKMNAVFDAYRQNLAGEFRRRDWKILCFDAMGMRQSTIAKLLHADANTVRQRKFLQSRALAKALAEFIPIEVGFAVTNRAVAA